MFLARLHAGGRDGPDCLFQIDLIPFRADNFHCAGSGEERKFKRKRRNSIRLVPCADKFGDRPVSHGFEIGRASGRERVCKSVLNWVVTASLKKKMRSYRRS